MQKAQTKEQQMKQILDEQLIYPVYQPIVSLKDGSVFGYEALSRIRLENCCFNVEEMFHLAEQMNCLFRLEAICRSKSIQGAAHHPFGRKLFINAAPEVINDQQFRTGMTLEFLEEYGLLPSDVIFEITERTSITDMHTFLDVIRHYTEQNFQIAIDDFGDGYAGINRVCALSPHFIKLDIGMVKNVDTDPLRQTMIKGIIESCQKYSIRVIGEGVETKEELHTLISLGVDFGQGYFLQKPDPEMKDLNDDVKGLICQYNSEVNPQRTNMFLWDEIGTIVHREQPVLAEESGEVLYQAFHHDHSLSEFCVVSKDSHVEGLITRRRLMETYGGLYGYNLYRRSTAGRLVEKDALVVDCKESIKTVATRALARPKEAVYDAIIVTNKGRYLGIVTMQDLLETTISIQVSQARSANPLTGLPGNNIIHVQLESVIHDESKAVVYFDLDNFKAYNDNYGFQNGDKMIQLMADCIQSACTNEFIGHIGGDDMMLIVDQDKAETIVTEILHAFHLHAIHLYSREDQQRGCIIAKDREGSQKQFLLASLSSAGVDITPQITSVEALMQKITTVKKLAKAVHGNSFVYMKKGYDVPVQVIPGK